MGTADAGFLVVGTVAEAASGTGGDSAVGIPELCREIRLAQEGAAYGHGGCPGLNRLQHSLRRTEAAHLDEG